MWQSTRTCLGAFMISMAGFTLYAEGGEKVAPQSVELFAAQEDGTLEVRFIPKNSSQATLILKNKTDKPLQVQLPAAFAGVPVLAQLVGGGQGGFGGQQGGFGGQQGGIGVGGGNQGVGGGLGGGGLGGGGFGGGGLGGQGGFGGGGGVFNVAPEATGKIRVATVCLEHGKNDPNPRIPYTIKPIEEFTKDPHVTELCRMLGRGEIDQTSAQAAAWHIANGLSWQELAHKVKVKHLDGSVELYFSPEILNRAATIAQVTMARVMEQSPAATRSLATERSPQASRSASVSATAP